MAIVVGGAGLDTLAPRRHFASLPFTWSDHFEHAAGDLTPAPPSRPPSHHQRSATPAAMLPPPPPAPWPSQLGRRPGRACACACVTAAAAAPGDDGPRYVARPPRGRRSPQRQQRQRSEHQQPAQQVATAQGPPLPAEQPQAQQQQEAQRRAAWGYGVEEWTWDDDYNAAAIVRARLLSSGAILLAHARGCTSLTRSALAAPFAQARATREALQAPPTPRQAAAAAAAAAAGRHARPSSRGCRSTLLPRRERRGGSRPSSHTRPSSPHTPHTRVLLRLALLSVAD